VLVVDDDPFSLYCLRMMLDEILHLKSDSGSNGQIGLDMFRRSLSCCPYKLIFMDVNMPVMNGLEASTLIRREVE
jgi:two-component system, sensor histidine kinase